MSKTFKYSKVVNSKYSPEIDETIEETEDFEYEVEDEELLDAVADLLFDEYFSQTDLADRCDYRVMVKDGLKDIISDYDCLDKLVETHERELKDYFEAEAMNAI